MKRCTHPDCHGVLYVEPADDAHVGPSGTQRTQFVCNLCSRVTGAPIMEPLALVRERQRAGLGR
jgi:hypothetical protein